MDQLELERLARVHTAPKKGKGYHDPEDVKALFRIARHGRSREDWKQAFQARRKARALWQRQQLEEACKGNWGAFRRYRKKSNSDWELSFADSHPDPHNAIHTHLQSIYEAAETVPEVTPMLPFVPFSMDELKHAVHLGKNGVCVSHDGVSQELLHGIMRAEGGADALLAWFNRLLWSGELPDNWYRSLMVVLPKTAHPVLPKELRPISMSSAISKTFCRVVLERSKPFLRPLGSCQCAGPTKQTTDYVFSAHRLQCLDHEWKAGLAYLKVDLEKAFDLVSRPALLSFLRGKLGDSFELRVWQLLLARSSASLETSWGCSEIAVERGIRQGSVESPLFFSCLAELTVELAAERHGWSREDPKLPGLMLSELLFVDDAVLWNSSLTRLAQRVEQWSAELIRCGLRINLAKCELYVSPHNPGPRCIQVGGTTLHAQPSLHIMGLQLHVQATTCEILAGLLGRAREVFWRNKTVLCANTPLHARLNLLEKVVAGAGLWCISAFFPETSALHLVNTFHMQLVITMMGLKRGPLDDWLSFRKKAFSSGPRRTLAWESPTVEHNLGAALLAVYGSLCALFVTLPYSSCCCPLRIPHA